MIRNFFLGLVLTTMLFGCVAGLDGNSVPDTNLIRDLTTISALVVTIETDKRGLDPNEVLTHVTNLETIVRNLRLGEPLDILVLNQYIAANVPYEYRTVTSLVLVLIKNRVDPVIKLPLPDVEKNEAVREVTLAVFEGIKAALELHIANQKTKQEA